MKQIYPSKRAAGNTLTSGQLLKLIDDLAKIIVALSPIILAIIKNKKPKK